MTERVIKRCADLPGECCISCHEDAEEGWETDEGRCYEPLHDVEIGNVTWIVCCAKHNRLSESEEPSHGD